MRSSASSMSCTGSIESSGPKISSRSTREPGSRPATSIGAQKHPCAGRSGAACEHRSVPRREVAIPVHARLRVAVDQRADIDAELVGLRHLEHLHGAGQALAHDVRHGSVREHP